MPDQLLVVSDGAPGLIRAIEECFPRSVRLAHKLRNLQSKVPEDQWPEFKVRAIACYQAASPVLARIRAAERWRSLRMTEFERRQLTASRDELDRAHAERTAPVTAPPTRLSSKVRT